MRMSEILKYSQFCGMSRSLDTAGLRGQIIRSTVLWIILTLTHSNSNLKSLQLKLKLLSLVKHSKNMVCHKLPLKCFFALSCFAINFTGFLLDRNAALKELEWKVIVKFDIARIWFVTQFKFIWNQFYDYHNCRDSMTASNFLPAC